MSQLLETMMIVCFGLSWPLSVIKSYWALTTKGKSLFFSLAVWIGYICGVAGKLVAGNINYVLIIYCFNLLSSSIDLLLYFRNYALDMQREKDKP